MNLPEQKEGDRPLTKEEHFDVLASLVRREMWRFELSKQHLRVLSILVELSFAMHRETVKIDRLRTFCDMTGMDKSNVSKALDDLARMRIVTSRRILEPALVEYTVEPDSDAWRCTPLQSDETLLDTLKWITSLNSAPQWAPQPKSAPDLPPDWND